MNNLKFIDLFAGIGGFHIALKRLGHKCVFASELSKELRALYPINHDMECHGDITNIEAQSIPPHDLLCAGFPCQSFSKAGHQKGMQEARGKLFNEIIKILSCHRPRYFILENVRNLLSHDQGNTWAFISAELNRLGYFFDKKILSPHYINIPQHRERIFIVGSLKPEDIQKMKWLSEEEYKVSVNQILSVENTAKDLEPDKQEVLKIWKNFISELPHDVYPVKPLWSMEFGATYPADAHWESMTYDEWKKYKGMYGYPLAKCKTMAQVHQRLPNYVKTQKKTPPSWKIRYIENNRMFYEQYKRSINKHTLKAIKNFNQESWKKLEWNCGTAEKIYFDKLIQFRGSGVRIKKNDYIPSLVTVSTQVPIIGKYMRYISVEEAAKAQSMPLTIKLPDTKAASFRVLGNMVNIELVYQIARALLNNKTIPQKQTVKNNEICIN